MSIKEDLPSQHSLHLVLNPSQRAGQTGPKHPGGKSAFPEKNWASMPKLCMVYGGSCCSRLAGFQLACWQDYPSHPFAGLGGSCTAAAPGSGVPLIICVLSVYLWETHGRANAGLIASTYHVVLYTPETTLEGLMRVTKSTVTMATLGAVFAATSCISAELRDAPEDPMNYFIGGCISGAMIGAKTNSFVIGSSSCVGLGALAAFVKVGRQQGWTFLVPPRQ